MQPLTPIQGGRQKYAELLVVLQPSVFALNGGAAAVRPRAAPSFADLSASGFRPT